MATIGPYRLLRTLGTGAFAKVYLGEHVETGDQIAIKVMKSTGDNIPKKILDMVQNEAASMMELNHSNIV
jgi:serine/threonine protein kinase